MKSSENEDLSNQKESEQKQEEDTWTLEEEAQHWLGGITASGKLWPNS
ncbi:MAG: hypothetical protein UU98_C0011G0001 [Parcubacteria group bacterium GW2011_GWD2_42_14]|nr:MAG: hypothetical protein UU98_C0011G0001 [Parcubacteria group bacterium GW2011_GWD2_42_14]